MEIQISQIIPLDMRSSRFVVICVYCVLSIACNWHNLIMSFIRKKKKIDLKKAYFLFKKNGAVFKK
ncbi:hypothetical protein, partial [Salmonella sp. s51933]|uniref:hypothetical protein n=1 Tax=Salmonella sp. s51933 TaxID=3160127 RepID=UPI0037544562